MPPTVEFQPTPNPNAGKFVLGRSAAPDGTSRSYSTPEEASDDPVARAILALDGVRSVFMVKDFITVSKTPAADWDTLAPRVTRLLEERP